MYYMRKISLPTTEFSASALQRHSDEVTHAASLAPVTITKRGKARFVLMSVEQYCDIYDSQDARQVFATSDIAPELLNRLMPEMERIISTGELDDA